MKKETNKKRTVINIIFLAVIAVLSVLDLIRRYVYGGSCLIKDVTGTPCPSCGMTRAFFSLFRLDFEKAFYYNPAFPAFPVALGLFVLILLKPSKKKLFTVLFFCDIAVVFAVWAVRLATGTLVY